MSDGVPLVFLDFETRSAADLTAVGGRAYCRHPSTELLCGCALVVEEGWSPCLYHWSPLLGNIRSSTDKPPSPRPELAGLEREYTWESVSPHPDVLDAASRGIVVAHNAHGFDRHMWDRLGWVKPGAWEDSLNLARRASLPGGLDAIGERLYGRGKDAKGHKLMMKYCKPGSPKGNALAGAFPHPVPSVVDAIVRYCARDVLLMACAWFDEGLGDDHIDDEVLLVHETIDERGIPIDLEYAARLTAAENALTSTALKTADAHGVSDTVLRSSSLKSGLPAWLAEQGFPVGDVQSKTVERLLQKIEEHIAFLQGNEPETEEAHGNTPMVIEQGAA